MNIPKYLFRQHGIIEPFKGNGAYGPIYGKKFEVKLNIQPKITLIKGPDGDDIILRGKAYFLPDVNLVPQSKLKVGKYEYEILDIIPIYGLNDISHYEAMLT